MQLANVAPPKGVAAELPPGRRPKARRRPSAMRKFCEDLDLLPSLVELRFLEIDFELSLEGLTAFTSRLRRLTNLQTIEMRLTGIDAVCVEKIAAASKEHPSLKDVRIRPTRLNMKEINAIFEAATWKPYGFEGYERVLK